VLHIRGRWVGKDEKSGGDGEGRGGG